MNPKSFLFALAIFSGGYLSNTLLDEAIDRAEKYFQIKASTYKTDADGYIICSNEQPNQALLKKTSSRVSTLGRLGEASGEAENQPPVDGANPQK